MQQCAPGKLTGIINKANNNYLGTQIESLMDKLYNCNQPQDIFLMCIVKTLMKLF